MILQKIIRLLWGMPQIRMYYQGGLDDGRFRMEGIRNWNLLSIVVPGTNAVIRFKLVCAIIVSEYF